MRKSSTFRNVVSSRRNRKGHLKSFIVSSSVRYFTSINNSILVTYILWQTKKQYGVSLQTTQTALPNVKIYDPLFSRLTERLRFCHHSREAVQQKRWNDIKSRRGNLCMSVPGSVLQGLKTSIASCPYTCAKTIT